MLPKTPVAAALAVVAVAALLTLAGEADAAPEAAPEPAPEPDPFFAELYAKAKKGIISLGKAVKNAIRRLRAGCRCNQAKQSCRCCTPIKVEAIKFNKEVCLVTQFRVPDFTANINITVNEKSVGHYFFAANKTQPICLSVPRIRSVRVCLRGHNFTVADNKLRLCLTLRVKYKRHIIAVVTFDCLQVKLPQEGQLGTTSKLSPGALPLRK